MIVYLDLISGISGDMTLGALVDLGVPLKWLKNQLSEIPLSGFDLKKTSISDHGIHATKVNVILTEKSEIRNYTDIRSLIKQSSLPAGVCKTSLMIFDRLATAEAHIHDCPKEKVHFHEVGAVDAIVDIVGAALGMEYLKITSVVASRVPLGNGWAECSHGKLPVPVPATMELLKGVPVYDAGIPHELVTPTGAAILTALACGFGQMPDMIVHKIGYGAGTRNLEAIPNLLRMVMGKGAKEDSDSNFADEITVVETCIDDMNPELFGFLMERLFEDGALDVYWIPVFMKKNRPGTMVQVLCPNNRLDRISDRILTETTTLGVRHYPAKRKVLSRKSVLIQTPLGEILAKQISGAGKAVRVVPEYEACKKIALEKNIPIQTVYDAVIQASGQVTS